MPNTVIAVTDAARHYNITIGRTYCDYKGIIHYKSFLINYNKRLWGQAITISRNHVQIDFDCNYTDEGTAFVVDGWCNEVI